MAGARPWLGLRERREKGSARKMRQNGQRTDAGCSGLVIHRMRGEGFWHSLLLEVNLGSLCGLEYWKILGTK